MKILIAEDETIIRLDLRGMLEHAGFEVCAEAGNGEEAVRLAHETQPDLVILDVKMPGVGGVEAARRILAERPMPIVMLTAYGDRETVNEAIRAGVFGYLLKPFREQDLVAAVETAFARHREWLSSRREVGREVERSRPVDISLGTDGKWPLRFRRTPDGALEVEITPEK
jgi:DNA-binding NarL/FixJ family response regulator